MGWEEEEEEREPIKNQAVCTTSGCLNLNAFQGSLSYIDFYNTIYYYYSKSHLQWIIESMGTVNPISHQRLGQECSTGNEKTSEGYTLKYKISSLVHINILPN